MAYRVDYADSKGQVMAQEKKHFFRSLIICFFLFLILVQLFWPKGQEAIQKLLLPGATETVWAAVDSFADRLQTGEPVGEALDALCRTVFQDAGILP